MKSNCSGCNIILSSENSAPSVLRKGGTCRKCRRESTEVRDRIIKYRKTPKGRYSHLKTTARIHNRPLELSRDEFVIIIGNSICSYCSGNLDSSGYGLDRVDQSKGYTKDNCVPCCGQCNRWKGRLEGLGFPSLRAIELLREVIERRKEN